MTKTKKLSATNTPKTKYFKLFVLFIDKFLISNIITTNKNKTAIAPTYTIINKKAKNSHSSKSKMPDDEIKLKTKQITECTEFCKIITDKELTTNKIEKKKNITFEFITVLIFVLMKEGFEPTSFGL